MFKYINNLYRGVAMNQFTEDEHGVALKLRDGERQSRSGLIKEMAKMQVAYQIGRDMLKREPTLKEVKDIRYNANSSLLRIKGGKFNGTQINVNIKNNLLLWLYDETKSKGNDI